MNNAFSFSGKGNVLAVGAHPDDIELGCGGTLGLLKKMGHPINLLVLTKGEASGDARIREIESIKSSKILEAENIRFGDIKDTMVRPDITAISVIEEQIDKLRPALIFTCFVGDTHQDHRNTGLATISAGRRSQAIVMYESPTSVGMRPTLFVDVSKTIQLKKKLLEVYVTQRNKDWMEAQAFMAYAKFRGFQSGFPVAEAFEVAKIAISDGAVKDSRIPKAYQEKI